MAGMCVVHPKEQAVAQCFQCHKGVCKSCVMIAPHGSFCGSECSVIYREMKQRAQTDVKKKMGTASRVALFFVILLGAFVVVHLVVRFGKVESLKSVDLIGSFLPASPEPVKPPQNQ